MHEDLKLNKLREPVECPRLALFMVKLASTCDPYKKAAYIEYYINEHKDRLQRDEVESMLKKGFKEGGLLREGVDIE